MSSNFKPIFQKTLARTAEHRLQLCLAEAIYSVGYINLCSFHLSFYEFAYCSQRKVMSSIRAYICNRNSFFIAESEICSLRRPFISQYIRGHVGLLLRLHGESLVIWEKLRRFLMRSTSFGNLNIFCKLLLSRSLE